MQLQGWCDLRGCSGCMVSGISDERLMSDKARMYRLAIVPSSSAFLPSGHSSVDFGWKILQERTPGVDQKSMVGVCVLTGRCTICCWSVTLTVNDASCVHVCW